MTFHWTSNVITFHKSDLRCCIPTAFHPSFAILKALKPVISQEKRGSEKQSPIFRTMSSTASFEILTAMAYVSFYQMQVFIAGLYKGNPGKNSPLTRPCFRDRI